MYQKLDLQQLQNSSLEEVKSHKEQAMTRKAELEALKVKGGKAWSTELQDELNDIAVLLVDIDERIEALVKEKEVKAEAPTYTPKKGTEDMVHLQIVQGRRFNPLTGAEESKPYTQVFTFSEWQVFKKNFKGLGYTIMAVLHDPYGDAKELVTKK